MTRNAITIYPTISAVKRIGVSLSAVAASNSGNFFIVRSADQFDAALRSWSKLLQGDTYKA